MSGSDENAVENNLVIHVLAPLATIGATWAVRKALDTSYRSITGHTAPKSQFYRRVAAVLGSLLSQLSKAHKRAAAASPVHRGLHFLRR